jgi:AraC family transcriptional regulator of arabinose operon
MENYTVNYSGITKAEPLQQLGPATKPHYVIKYVLSGSGTFSVGGNEYLLKKGDGFIVMPNELALCQSSKDEPWTYAYVAFNFDGASELLGNIGLSPDNLFFKSKKTDEIHELVNEMTEYITCDLSAELRRNGLLSILFSIIAEAKITSAKSEADRAKYYVNNAINFIHNNYCIPIKITDVADYVGINRSYLFTLFKQVIDVSPHQFMANYRLDKAAELLRTTNLPVESIALSCGYVDSLVFAKAFKQVKGISPSAHRKSVKP